MKFGLDENIITELSNIFKMFPEVEEVIIYGSRSKGNYKKGSDIDLTLKGKNLTLQLINEIDLIIDDLLTPYNFDLSIYQNINDPALIEHINRVGQSLYKKEKFVNSE